MEKTIDVGVKTVETAGVPTTASEQYGVADKMEILEEWYAWEHTKYGVAVLLSSATRVPSLEDLCNFCVWVAAGILVGLTRELHVVDGLLALWKTVFERCTGKCMAVEKEDFGGTDMRRRRRYWASCRCGTSEEEGGAVKGVELSCL
ncbi:hypothetical protein DFH09DRAFT_1104344 [Mycena vulgaris]|nr:hypothetical protein DFH09DRAFT_1104344 [Mycena vulgaris]